MMKQPTNERAVEAVARAMAEADGLHPLDDPMKHYGNLAQAALAAATPIIMEEAAGIAEGFTRFADKPDHADAPKLIAQAIRAAKTDGAAHDR